jgi:hypothetical protein
VYLGQPLDMVDCRVSKPDNISSASGLRLTQEACFFEPSLSLSAHLMRLIRKKNVSSSRASQSSRNAFASSWAFSRDTCEASLVRDLLTLTTGEEAGCWAVVPFGSGDDSTSCGT